MIFKVKILTVFLNKITSSKEGIPDTCIPMFTAALFTIAKVWKRHKCPSTDEWVKKTWYIYTMVYYSAIKKDEILPFATTWVDLEGIILIETSHTKKDEYSMLSLKWSIIYKNTESLCCTLETNVMW